MKKIFAVLFVVSCMAIISCQQPTDMTISGGHVTVDNFPPQYQTFPAPAFVQLGASPSNTFDLYFRIVPNAWKYEYFVKIGNEKFAQIRSLNPSSYSGTVSETYPVGIATCSKQDVKHEFSNMSQGDSVRFGVAAIAPGGTMSEIRWSEEYPFW